MIALPRRDYYQQSFSSEQSRSGVLNTTNDIKALLGRDWSSTRFVESQIRSHTKKADMQITELHLLTAQGDKIPATFVQAVKPSTPGPAILYCHAHGNRYDIGKCELLEGRKALLRPYAHELVALGFQVLCIDMPCFGERQHLLEAATAKACFWFGDTLYGWMLSELMAGVTYLSEHPDVDANRIASFGISMGGTHAWWLSALDERIRASVALCCFADLACLVEQKQHDIHGIYMSVPGLLAHTSTAKLAARACPRAQFFGIGLQDAGTPERCVEKARNELNKAYRDAGAQDNLVFHVEPDLGHEESAAMRANALIFLQQHLAE